MTKERYILMFYHFAWYFFLFSCIGWCAEVGYAAVVTKKFVNRGFLLGPYCPIYGFGIGLIYLLSVPFSKNLLVLWVGSVIVTSGIELITGFAMDKLFHNKWWDYSDFPLNVGGYICVPFSILWGFACVAVVKLIFPFTNGLINIIPHTIGVILIVFLSVVFATDAIISTLTALGLNKKLEHMDRLAKILEEQSQKLTDKVTRAVQNAAEFCEEVGDRLSDGKNRLLEKLDIEREHENKLQETPEAKEKYEEMAKTSNILQRRLIAAFPNMKHKKYTLHLEAICEKIHRRGKKKKTNHRPRKRL